MTFIRFNEMSETWKEYKKKNACIAVTFWTIDDVRNYSTKTDLTDAQCEDILEAWDRHGMDGVQGEGNQSLECVVDDAVDELTEAAKAKKKKANKKKAGSK